MAFLGGQLPDEMVHCILEQLPQTDVGSVCLTNKYCYNLASQPQHWLDRDNHTFEIMWSAQNPFWMIFYQFTRLDVILGRKPQPLTLFYKTAFVRVFREKHLQLSLIDTSLASLFAGLNPTIILASLLVYRATRGSLADAASLFIILPLSLYLAAHFPLLTFLNWGKARSRNTDTWRLWRLTLYWMSFVLPLFFWNSIVFREVMVVINQPAEPTLISDLLNLARLATLTGCTVLGGLIGITWASVLEVSGFFENVTDAYAPYLFAPLLSMIQQHYYAVSLISRETCLLAALIYVPTLRYIYGKDLFVRVPPEAVLFSMLAVALFGVFFSLLSWVTTAPSPSWFQILWLSVWLGFARAILDWDTWEKYIKCFCALRSDKTQVVTYNKLSRSFYLELILVHSLWIVLNFTWILL